VVAAILVIIALPLFILGVSEPHTAWRFTVALFCFILLFGYVAVTGKAPFRFG
jgi:hypothetical membrane protein